MSFFLIDWVVGIGKALISLPGAIVEGVGDFIDDPIGCVGNLFTGAIGLAEDLATGIWNTITQDPACLMCVGSAYYWAMVKEMTKAKAMKLITSESDCIGRRQELLDELFDGVDIPGHKTFWNCACHMAFSEAATPAAIAGAETCGATVFALSADDQITGVPAAVSAFPGRLDFLARGTDDTVLHKCYNQGRGWHPSNEGWSSLGGTIQQPPAIISWGADRLDLFVCGGDRCLWHKCYNGQGGWYPSEQGWNSLGGQLCSAPSVATWGPNTLHIVARSIDSSVHYIGYNGDTWSGWRSLAGSTTHIPKIVAWGGGRLDVFARGSDGDCWHRGFEGGWAPDWDSLGGGPLAAAPSVASFAPGRLDVVIRKGSDLFHKCYNLNGGWYPAGTDWSYMGSGVRGMPCIISNGPGRLLIVARGEKGNVLFKSYTEGKGWYPGEQEWKSLGGNISGSPTLVAWGPEYLGVLARGKSGGIWYKDYNRGAGWIKKWINLGGDTR
ncbi:MAG: hypothetical protein RBT75_08690 [Anaerolineae bacterium]|nr:hypothetical protein [Anaerolineae bacterium]